MKLFVLTLARQHGFYATNGKTPHEADAMAAQTAHAWALLAVRSQMEADMEVSNLPSAHQKMIGVVTVIYYGGPHDGAKEMMANPPAELRVPQFRTIRYNLDGNKSEFDALVGWASYKMDYTNHRAEYTGFIKNAL